MGATLFLAKGLAIGFAIAAPVGPIGVLCIRRTFADGRLAGFVTGLGAATADAFYGAVAGFGFYQHAETPGLGGEVDNPKWKGLWLGKTLFDAEGKLAIRIIKGNVDAQSPQATHQVDGLAGATLTSKGVDNLLHFWLGQNGFGPFIANLRAGGA